MQATTRVDVTHIADGQRAGLALFGVTPSWLGLTRIADRVTVTFCAAGVETYGPAVAAPTIDLRADVSADQTVRFSFSLDYGRSFQPFGNPAPLRFSWWKGARPALFTYTKSGTGDGWIDVDWFHTRTLP
jgi:hypothetical protein